MTEQQLKNFFNKYDEINDKVYDIVHIMIDDNGCSDNSLDEWSYESFDDTIRFTYTQHHGGDWNTTKHLSFPLSWLTLDLDEVKHIWNEKVEKEEEEKRLKKEKEEQLRKQKIEDAERALYEQLKKRYGKEN